MHEMEATGDGGKNMAPCIIFKCVVNQTLKTMLFPDGHSFFLPSMFPPFASNTLSQDSSAICIEQHQTKSLGALWG